MTNRRGHVLIETLIAVIISLIVMAAMVGGLMQQQRFYQMAGDVSETVGDLQRVETAILPELLPINPAAGDLVFAGQDSIKVRTSRGVYAICDKRVSTDVIITVRGLTGSSLPLRPDSAFVYMRGWRSTLTDDSWMPVKLKNTAPDVCPDSTPGWRANVPVLTVFADQVPVGSPVRVFRHASYWLAANPDGWYLKTNATNGSPMVVSGPLAPIDSAATSTLRFRYLDDEGDPAGWPSMVSSIAIELAGVGKVPGRRGGVPYATGRRLVLDVRNR
ncbi:MAG: hypothetical protein GWN99_11235 [Gemmatimonadetes bacterium]|uniref:Prepilin-type N-terminal cleavage/methylation domain-containing protein n=1 Tax=Candidatus Kutchimonas denitrificans TaxID=3056748 RepID=A0AAE5C809_9BACT|nr:hypothetical protein [Gemmatimonadota bacterium]NIR74056.1 hypothetical protein [Candidatus Kutchimonas denitrificans]NIS01618.1 hypothetical protein [Gemmatimonadota bacterium]NIT67356.1 hypothetical protein [Gemmatimonadota bacterium]NIU52719.1 hypothetical protein [Gemmatimonadota bacterium]